MRLPKSLRLARWGDFARVRRDGRSVAGRFLVMGVVERGGAEKGRDGFTEVNSEAGEGFRVGFVTSKKVGNAVMRNLVRRRLRAVVREFGGALRGGVDIVTVARFRAGAASFEQLRKEWRWLARKAGIWIDVEENGDPAVHGGEILPKEVGA